MSYRGKIKSLFGMAAKPPATTTPPPRAAVELINYVTSLILRTDLVKPQIDRIEEIKKQKQPGAMGEKAYLAVYLELEKFIVEHEPLVVKRKFTVNELRAEIRAKIKIEELTEEFGVLFMTGETQMKILYKMICAAFSKPIIEILGASALQRYLNKASKGTLLDGIKIEMGRADISIAEAKLSKMPEERRRDALTSAFRTLFSSLYESTSVSIGKVKAREFMENAYKSVQKVYGNLQSFSEIIKTMPFGVLEEEKLALLSKEELEQKVRERTKELKKALIEAREATAAAEVARTAMENIMNTMVDSMIVVDYNGYIRIVNKATIALLGYSEEELINKPVDTIFVKPAAAEAVAAVADREEGILRRYVERALDESDEQILLLSKDFKIIKANKAFLNSLGYRERDVVGKHCYSITHKREKPCEPPEDTCPIDEAIRTGKPHVEIHTHFDKAGNKLFVNVVALPLRDKNGKIATILHLAKRVKEGEKKEEPMITALKKVEDILIVATDKMFRGVGLEKLMEKGFVKDIEMTYLTKDGKEIPMSFSGSVMRDEEGKLSAIVCVAKDLSEIKKAKSELEKAYAKLERTHRELKKYIEELEKTQVELKDKVTELEKFHELTVGRELRMIELKEEIKELKKKLGEE